MKIKYDISVLGGGITNQRARTGIFRVVEQLLLQLASRPEVELELASMEYPSKALRYLKDMPSLSRIPFPHRPLLQLEEVKYDLSCRSKECGFPAKQGLKVARELLSGPNKLLKFLFAGAEKRCLQGGDIFHSPFLPLPPGLSASRRFITVYDLIPILFPQYFGFKEDHLLNRVMESIDGDTWVFCISEATRNDLLNYHRSVDPDKVAVIPLGASSLFHPCDDSSRMELTRKKLGIPDRPYFLSVATLEPRKNIDSTIRAFGRLMQQEKIKDCSLVLVGTKGWDFDQIFHEIDECKGLKDRVIVTGYVDDRDLAPLYSGALAFVYPSFYEGFGLPPLEAMQCGTPVVTSNTSSLPEVVGDAGLQVAPQDSDALCQAMLDLYEDAALRKELSTRSRRRATLFSWEACADTTIAHYRRASKENSSITGR